MGIGSIISAASGLAGLAGSLKGGKVESAPVSGYATYPQWLKDLYEKTFAPAAVAEYQKEYQALPMTRYESVDPFFGSAQLSALQRMSDAQGGMFGKYNDPNAQAATDATANAEQKAKEMADLEARMIARQYLGGMGANPAETTAQALRRQKYEAGLYDDSGLASIGKYIQAAGDMNNVAGADVVRRDSPAIYEAYGQALQNANLEALRRKGLA